MIEFLVDNIAAIWISIIVLLILYYLKLDSNSNEIQTTTESNYPQVPLTSNSYPQQTNNSNNYEPAISKALDLAAGAFTKEKTTMEFLGGALQGDFSTQRVSKTRVGVALAASIFAAVAASAKVSETTTRAGVENQFDFGKKKLEDEKKHSN